MFQVKTVARRAVLIGALGGPAFSEPAGPAQDRREMMGPLRIHPENPRYFTDGSGRAIYLTGSHTWSNLQDQGPKDPPKPFDYEAYLDFLRERNHNFIRLWAWEQARGRPGPTARGRTPPTGSSARTRMPHRAGHGARRQAQVRPREVGRRVLRPAPHAGAPGGRAGDLRLGDAVPGLELGQGLAGRHALARPPVPPREQHPGLERQHERRQRPGPRRPARPRAAGRLHPQGDRHAERPGQRALRGDQRGRVQGLGPLRRRDGARLREGKPKQHPVGLTGHGSENNDEMLASPADWFSPGSNQWPDLKTDPRAVDGKKVSLLDTDHVFGVGGDQKWVWKAFLRGHNVLFMDPYDDPSLAPGSLPARGWACATPRRAAGRWGTRAATPDASTSPPAGPPASWPRPDTAWRSPGAEYLVYLPDGGEATVDLAGARGKLAVEWSHPITGKTTPRRARSKAAENAPEGALRRRRRPLPAGHALSIRARSAEG